MGKITIIEGNSSDKDNVRVLMVKGEKGYSAYEIYVQSGGTLTEEEWLDEFLNAENFYNKDEVDNLLEAKAGTEDLSTVATSGSYNDLENKPTIPTVNDSYNTSTSNAYSCNYFNTYVNNLVNYSTNEIIVGTWLNKPLYRKVIPLQSSDFGTGTAVNPQGVLIAHNIQNIDYVVNWSCRWKRTSTGDFRDFPNSSPSNDEWHGHMIVNATNLFFELGIVLVNTLRTDSESIYAVVEYTKTETTE